MPSGPAVVAFDCPPSVTVTASPGSALPQTLLLMPCWMTMWSPNMLLSDTSACTAAVESVRTTQVIADAQVGTVGCRQQDIGKPSSSEKSPLWRHG